jgi:hypothetical protein
MEFYQIDSKSMIKSQVLRKVNSIKVMKIEVESDAIE